MANGYFATKLSDNIGETPDGFRICRNVILARTGWQKYLVSDLIKNFKPERLAELGVDTSNPSASIDLYRPAEEVFAAQTILSAEGKTFTDGHPPVFVSPENFQDYARGHIQNVHKGSEPLESGDWPLVGDIIINDGDVINKVDYGVREISLGYVYDLRRDGDKLLQVGFIINHAALVPVGRAGHEARINDSAPGAVLDEETLRQVEAAVWEQPGSAQDARTAPIIPTEARSAAGSREKEKKAMAVKKTMRETFLELIGFGLKAKATDGASASELAEYAVASARALDGEESEEERKKRESEDARHRSDDSHRADDMKRADDEKKRADDAMKRADDEKKRADDAEAELEKMKKGEETDGACKPGEDGHKKCTADKCVAMDRGARDADGGDHRSRMHAALDNMLDKHEEMHGPLEGEDADVEELKELMGKFLTEEAGEPEHQEADGSEMLEPVGEMEGEHMANDAAQALFIVIDKSPERAVLGKAFDSAASLDSEVEFLNAIKPAIAKSRDRRVRQAFNVQVQRHRTSRKADGGYAAFAAAALAHDAERIADGARQTTDAAGRPFRDNKRIQEVYDAARNGKPLVK